MRTVAVIDYGMGNLDSVVRAVEECGENAVVVSDPESLHDVDSIILPGVGSFADGVRRIRETGMEKALGEKVLGEGIPFLGICLGMQLLADKGYEGGESKGLGWIDGEVKKFVPDQAETKIPHVGWNEVHFSGSPSLFKGLPSGKDFYFVHSYYFACEEEENIIGRTPYCGEFVSAVRKKNIFGTQFHPEKSLQAGLKVISNFLEL